VEWGEGSVAGGRYGGVGGGGCGGRRLATGRGGGMGRGSAPQSTAAHLPGERPARSARALKKRSMEWGDVTATNPGPVFEHRRKTLKVETVGQATRGGLHLSDKEDGGPCQERRFRKRLNARTNTASSSTSLIAGTHRKRSETERERASQLGTETARLTGKWITSHKVGR